MLSLPLFLGLAAAQSMASTVKVDPLLIVQADEVWSVIGRRDNAVWPGWDARKTPILIYLPGKQDLLINHPKPPEGFLPYHGPIKSHAGPIFYRDGKTTFDSDGQNTSTPINGIETLVVADTLSVRRQWVKGIAGTVIADPATADETIANSLTPNPYASMLMFAHEAFHVYQRKQAPAKAPHELDLLRYPSLSVENNVGFALEAQHLAAALRAKDEATMRKEARIWLAVRLDRRKTLAPSAAQYEDATEFTEGLAKYVEYRSLEVLEGHKPSREMWLVQGFHGYDGLAIERDRMIRQMQGFLNGTNIVNNDPYGASPVRFRLYFSGMAVGALLDRLGAKWHDPIFRDKTTLGSLAEKALHATPAELTEALSQVHATEDYAKLVREKSKLAEDGAAHVDSELKRFEQAPGELILDYSGVKTTEPSLVYTSFGILRIDDNRNLYRLIPIRGEIGGMKFTENASRPVLQDRKDKTLNFQLTAVPSVVHEGTVDGLDIDLPGVSLKHVKGSIHVEGRRVFIKVSK